ncbi:GPI mannosyltransferase 3-like [Gordionus sp. m RMFG-2023]|uniref:GPI mannosyltransferase 3-like n=1 Tax=Gordionus sp. m RMFG-2023 TaxID=3053472 RepID=UPI0031FBBE56
MIRPICVVIFIIIFRLFNCWIIRTFYVPDEYWQALEPAYQNIYGYGELTWEWKHGLSFSGIDTKENMILGPKIMMTIFGIMCDIIFYIWCQKLNYINKELSGKWIFFAYISNWFIFYCVPRSLANTLEMYFYILIIYFYPHWSISLNYKINNRFIKDLVQNSPYIFLIFSTIFYRPTSVPLIILLVFHYVNLKYRFNFIIIVIINIILSCLLHLYVDYIFYKSWQLTWYNFIKFNYFHNISILYGTQPWYWYMLIGIPVILGLHVLPVMYEFFYSKLTVISTLILSILILSIFPHKEFRFLLPIIPFFSILAGNFYAKLDNGKIAFVKKLFPDHWKIIKNVYIGLVIIIHLNMAIYFSLIHQRGTIDILKYIYKQSNLQNTSTLLLMPCYSTPHYSHLHKHINIRMLSCEPKIKNDKKENSHKTSIILEDEYAMFLNNPDEFLQNIMEKAISKNLTYTHICFYSNVYPKLESSNYFKSHMKYTYCKEFFHTHFPYDNMSRYIICLCVTNSMDIPNPSFWITYLLIIILNIDYKVQKPPDAETSPSPDFLKTSTTTTYTKSLYNTFYIKKKLWTQLAENIQISHQ